MDDDERDDTWSEPDDTWSEPDDERGRDVAAMLAALVVGVVATLLLVLLWNQLSSPDEAPGPAARADASGLTTTGPLVEGDAASETGHAPHGASRLTRCASAYERLRVPLDAAQASLDQWSVHVGAMNQLVVGEITLQQATDFWDDTRLGARRRLGEFHRAFDDLRREGVDCPDPGLLAPGDVALPSCARAVRAEVAALGAAQVSIATWEEHVHHMDMLRLGQMTPERATSLWLASWQQGVRELRDYEAASRATRPQDGCDGAAATE